MRKHILRNLEGKPKIYATPPTWITASSWLKKALEEVRKVAEGEEE